MYDEQCKQERSAHFRLDVSALSYLSYEVVCGRKYKHQNNWNLLLKFKKLFRFSLWTCGYRCVSGHGHPVAGLPPEPHRQMSELHGCLPGSVPRHQGLSVLVPAPGPGTEAGPLRLEYISTDGSSNHLPSSSFYVSMCSSPKRQNFIVLVVVALCPP